MTISEAFAHYRAYYLVDTGRSAKTIKEYEGRFFGRNGIIQTVGDIDVEHFGLDHVVRWKLHMRDQGLQATYINHNLSGLRWFLKWLREHEYHVMDWHRVSFDKEQINKPKTVLTPAETGTLIEASSSLRDKALIALFFGTGCRSAEILGLDRADWSAASLVDAAAGVWEIWVLGKNQKYRPVCLYQDVKDAVDRYLLSRSDAFKPLFISQQNRRIQYVTVSRMLHKLARTSGLDKRVTQHVFRHSFATEMAANGMPIPTLAYSLGHKDGSVTQKIYTHIDAARSRQAYGKYHPKLRQSSLT